MKRVACVAFALLAGTIAALADPAPCQIVRDASVDLTIQSSGHVSVPVSIGDKTLNLLVDTGAIMSLLTKPTVDDLALPMRDVAGTQFLNHDQDSMRFFMFGGAKVENYVIAHDARIGNVHMEKVELMVLPGDWDDQTTNGLLGPDIMTRFDVEFDFAAGKFNLFEPNVCAPNLAYWSPANAVDVPFKLGADGHIEFDVQIDGKTVRAIMDTGSYNTVLSLETAKILFGIGDKDLKVLDDMRYGHTYQYPFKALTFAGIQVNNPRIELMSNSDRAMMDGGQYMLLGMNILRQLHFYIAYRRHDLFVTAASAH